MQRLPGETAGPPGILSANSNDDYKLCDPTTITHTLTHTITHTLTHTITHTIDTTTAIAASRACIASTGAQPSNLGAAASRGEGLTAGFLAM